MFPELQKLSVRSLVVLSLVLGGVGLAVIDKNFRPKFGEIVSFGLGGYFGQLNPRQ
ncbi:hypothetical protein IQ247_13780 [Plectonema cf. radiosum LEGE 06105]|uniref:Uncharacterized protein n=1 Tax=Plectonema cf. radiosum LEGE 06105 TaxID=945769 RepID=A0A8J7F2K8_9CYAN|nr:hypothetical protein [Plectonema radiosum]MBE9213722.1 hypothetical protein [Plectonema cf. radiosum LEGE 06105]